MIKFTNQERKTDEAIRIALEKIDEAQKEIDLTHWTQAQKDLIVVAQFQNEALRQLAKAVEQRGNES